MRSVIITLLVLLFSAGCLAQSTVITNTTLFGSTTIASGGVVVTGGFTYLQGTSGSEGTGGWEVQSNACGSSFQTACTLIVKTTTAGSDMVIGRVMGEASTGHITSAFSCVSSNPCLTSSGDKVDTFSLCPSSSCLVTNSGQDHDDAAYVAGGAGGANVITVNVSAAPVSFDFGEFGEILPPLCGASPCATVVDNSGNGSTAFSTNGSCGSSCVGPAFTVTGTDGIIEIIDSNAAILLPGSAYTLDFIGNVFSFDNTTGTGIPFSTTAAWTLTGLAFKTTSSYSAPAKPFSNLAPGPPSQFMTGVESCTPTCPGITLPVTVNTAGNLIVIFAQVEPGQTQATISSISDNKSNSYTVPSAANTCKQTGGTIDLSCAYSVITTTGVTTLTPVMSASTNAYFMYYLVSASSGTIALDAQNSSFSSSSSSTVTGQTLSLSGGTSGLVDACFAEMGFAGSGTSPVEIINTLYPLPQGANFFGGNADTDANGGSMMSLNQRNGNAPIWILNSSATAQESSGICFHN